MQKFFLPSLLKKLINWGEWSFFEKIKPRATGKVVGTMKESAEYVCTTCWKRAEESWRDGRLVSLYCRECDCEISVVRDVTPGFNREPLGYSLTSGKSAYRRWVLGTAGQNCFYNFALAPSPVSLELRIFLGCRETGIVVVIPRKKRPHFLSFRTHPP